MQRVAKYGDSAVNIGLMHGGGGAIFATRRRIHPAIHQFEMQ